MHGLACLALQVAQLGPVHQVAHRFLRLPDDVCNFVEDFRAGVSVANSHGEASVNEPVVDCALQRVDEVPGTRVPDVIADNVHDAPRAFRAKRRLIQLPRHDVAIVDDELRVGRVQLRSRGLFLGVSRRIGRQVDGGHVHGHDLLASPVANWRQPRAGAVSATWHHDGWLGNAAIPRRVHGHDDVEEEVLLNEGVSLRDEAAAQQRVLHDAHDRPVGLRRDEVAERGHEFFGLHDGGDGLQRVHVHLIPVEIGVVWRRARQVHAERGVVQDFGTVTHDGHLMQGGLAVKQDVVAVAKVALHNPPLLKLQVAGGGDKAQVMAGAVTVNDIPSPWVGVRAILNQLLQLSFVESMHSLWNGEGARDGAGHAHLLDADAGVGGND